jgi:putative transposase
LVKIKRKITRLHSKIASIRKDQIHKASSAISKNHAVAIKEDLRVVNMTGSRKGMRRHVREMGRGGFEIH